MTGPTKLRELADEVEKTFDLDPDQITLTRMILLGHARLLEHEPGSAGRHAQELARHARAFPGDLRERIYTRAAALCIDGGAQTALQGGSAA